MACPSLPTCGLGLAESERMLPGLIDRIEKLCAEVGLGRRGNHHPLDRLPERLRAALHGGNRVSSARRRDVIKSGSAANAAGTRLNRVWKDVIKEADIETELRPVLARFAKERNAGERFGDWCDRVLLEGTVRNTTEFPRR